MCTAKTRIVIVDDHPLIVQGLGALLAEEPHLEVLCSFTQGHDLLSFLKSAAADVVILDISLPDTNGIDLCKEIKLLAPQIRVIALTNHNERSMIMQMLQNGANGYLLKNASSAELIEAISSVLKGQIAFSKSIQEIIAQPGIQHMPLPKLTRREQEVLKLIAQGGTSVEIADKLYVSPLTIETHRRNLLQKFKVRNVAELIKHAFQQGILD